MNETNLGAVDRPTRGGSIRLFARPEVLAGGSRPVVVMIHGALRNSEILFPWLSLLEPAFDVAFVNLPGHGNSPALFPVSVDNFAANIGDALGAIHGDRAIVVVGESLGGLVGLVLGGLGLANLRGVVAADPPLTMSKLWHISAALRSWLSQFPDEAFWQQFAFNIFGVRADGIDAQDRIYYPALARISVPTCILSGDLPLFPARQVAGVPCLIDAVDRHVIERYKERGMQFHTIQHSGHVLLANPAPQCLQTILQFCREVTQPAPTG